MEAPLVAPVGSIPTRSRHPLPAVKLHRTAEPLLQPTEHLILLAACLGRRRVVALALLVGLAAAPSAPLAAQDSLGVPRADTAAAAPADTARTQPDTTVRRPPTSPTGAMLRSIVLPGWGQFHLGRKLTGGLFVAFEGVTLGMVLTKQSQLRALERAAAEGAEDTEAIQDKRQEREDWIVLMAFNHLLSGLEAYVSGHLWDFPGDLRLQALPGGVGGSVTLPIRIR
jgi:hypothetical protein